MDLKELFVQKFGYNPSYKVSSGGRIEIIGNHTDHNHGLCCAATCNLQIHGFMSPRADTLINYYSIGYDPIHLSLDCLDKNDNEYGTSLALIKGVAFYLKSKGYDIGGFDIITDSSIFAGAGVSSSAAYESLIGQIFNCLYNSSSIDKITLAKAGQFAENAYFGKQSGLLDQIGTCFGNISYIDFKDINFPIVDQIQYPFNDLDIFIVNTGGSHAGLSSLYSSIPEDMLRAAKKLGHDFLRECNKHDDPSLTEMERKRANHFFNENERVKQFKKAFETKDKQKFLEIINESRKSSTEDLQNMMVNNVYQGSPLEACDIAMSILKGNGACRINGGGFAGSIICFVPSNIVDSFVKTMSDKYGKQNVVQVSISPNGPLVEKI